MNNQCGLVLVKRILGLAMLVGVAGAQPAAADDLKGKYCDLRTLDGLYLFSASGFNIPATGAPVPKVIAEFIRFDGEGGLTSPGASVVINGVKLPASPPSADPGVYTLGDDCVGTLAFGPPPAPAFDILVSPQGTDLVLVQTGQPPFLGLPVMQGPAYRVSR